MGFSTKVRTERLLRINPQIAAENTRFLSHLHMAFNTAPVVAALSNYVHDEDQNFKRRDMFAVTDTAFNLAWPVAVATYENSPEGDSTAHTRFMALLRGQAPYERYDYHELLNENHRKTLVDMMIELVRRG